MTLTRNILACQINPIVGDLEGNSKKILSALERAKKQGNTLVVFPEMALTGYPPEDLLLDDAFIDAAEEQLGKIMPYTEGLTVIIGTVRKSRASSEKKLFNTAAILQDGKLLGFQDKRLLPTYDVFDERRYFEPGKETRLFNTEEFSFCVLLCEDMWQHQNCVTETQYSCDPVKDVIALKSDLIIVITASPYHFDKSRQRLQIAQNIAKDARRPLLLACQVGANDQLIFDGYSAFINETGALVQVARGFEEDFLEVGLHENQQQIVFREPFVDLQDALVLGISDYFKKQGFKKACLGLSGGVDSALVACLAVEALGKENVVAVSMPSRFTSKQSEEDAITLSRNLGIELKTIPIESSFCHFLELLEPVFGNKPYDVTEENLQARIRGLILMALANKEGYLLLNTGNKSEFAMGYCTLYGDMCGALSVIADVSKTRVYALCAKMEKIPQLILAKAPSAELREGQKDSDTLPDYAILDRVIEEFVEKQKSVESVAKELGLERSFVEDIVQKIARAEYKRRQGAPVLRVTPRSLLVGRRYPIVQNWIK